MKNAMDDFVCGDSDGYCWHCDCYEKLDWRNGICFDCWAEGRELDDRSRRELAPLERELGEAS